MIEWAPLEWLVKPVRSGTWGRPSYPPLAMLKALFLQRWYSLSDEGLEEALSDRPDERSYGYRRVRYRGLNRNRAQLLLMCMAINLRRADRRLAGLKAQ
jgi:hypothetical protein